jgi:pimeloyl-ACP methyl ester carboxylesterase
MRLWPCLLIISLSGCSAVAFRSPTMAQSVTGTAADGSLYEMDVSDNWNGHLWLYAHGMMDPQAQIALPEDYAKPYKTWLLEHHFAFAMSSYSKNGYVVEEGALDTYELKQLFTDHFGAPTHTYIFGHSMGGAITEALVEGFPNEFDGSLPVCAPLAGTKAELKYFENSLAAFNQIFPGILPSTVDSFSDPALNPAINDLTAQFNLTLQFAALTHLPGSTPDEVLNSATQVIRVGSVFVQEVRPQPHPYVPTGLLRHPMLTLHTTADQLVPFEQEAAYAAIVAKAGASEMLVQRSVNVYGHCNITTDETIQGMRDLVLWANGGIRPN